jgi:hypothetical protein
MDHLLTRFKSIFWDAFHKPKLLTEKFSQVWESLEPVNDMLAGPFYSIYTNGDCDYVFQDKNKFPDIKDADDFLDYCTWWIQKYIEAVSSETASSEEERKDLEILLFQTDLKMELAQLAYEIQKGRDQSSG